MNVGSVFYLLHNATKVSLNPECKTAKEHLCPRIGAKDSIPPFQHWRFGLKFDSKNAL